MPIFMHPCPSFKTTFKPRRKHRLCLWKTALPQRNQIDLLRGSIYYVLFPSMGLRSSYPLQIDSALQSHPKPQPLRNDTPGNILSARRRGRERVRRGKKRNTPTAVARWIRL